MKIYHAPTLPSKFCDCNLFVDTNVLIGALKNIEFLRLIHDIKENGCELLSIKSVFFEFVRGGGSVQGFNERASFFQSLLATYPIERQIDQLEELIVVLQRLSPNMSYTDFLLAACAYRFPDSYLMTSDHSDFPSSIFVREEVITVDNEKEINNYGIYSLSKERFNKAASNLLKRT